MIKKICICDRCMKETISPVIAHFNELEIEEEDFIEPSKILPESIHLCNSCMLEVYKLIKCNFD